MNRAGRCYRRTLVRKSGSARVEERGRAGQQKAVWLLVLLLVAWPLQSFAVLRGSRENDGTNQSITPDEILSKSVRASQRKQIGRSHLSRRTQVIEVRQVDVELSLVLHYVDDDAAALLAAGDPETSVVQRFCSAVNQQAGGSQARKSAEEDSLTLFTRDYEYPQTGCKILGTNKMYTYGVPPGPSYSSLEISFRQEVFVSHIGDGNLDDGDMPLVDRVTLHSSAGFSRGNGGRARFRKRLKSLGPEPVPAFDTVEDLYLIDGLSPPMSRPTTAPSVEPTSAWPTRSPTNGPTMAPMTGVPAPSVEPTLVWPTRSPTNGPTMAPMTGVPSHVPTGRPMATTMPKTSTEAPVTQTLPPTTPPPSSSPTAGATDEATMAPSGEPSEGKARERDRNSGKAGGNGAEWRSSGGGSPQVPTAAIAAAAGAGLGILAVGLFTLWRCKTDDDDTSHGGKIPHVATGGASPSARHKRSTDAVSPGSGVPPPAPPSATSSVARLGARRAPPVPSVVALPEGGEVGSVADSTLGDRTAGRKPPLAARPPVSILKTSMRHDIGGGASSIAASSQISSLESGTIGAGGDRTLGGFSLEAAIKEGSAGEEEEMLPDTPFCNRAPANSEKRDPPCQLNIEDAAVGAALLSAVVVSEKENEGRPRTPVGGETPTESLAGTTSLMGASYQSTTNSSSKEGEESNQKQTPVYEPTSGIEASSDGDVTPRASGTRITNLNVDLEDGLLFPLHSKDRVEPSSYLPKNLVGDRLLEQSRMSSPSPPSFHSTSDSQTSWSDVFAAGTAAILSASFEQATSDDAEDEENDDPTLGVIKKSPLPKKADAVDESPVPPVIGGRGTGFPDELAGSRMYPPDFPDSGPLKDANSSDGRESSVQGTPEDNVTKDDIDSLSEGGLEDWPKQLHEPGPFAGSRGHHMSDTVSAVSSIPPPPPEDPPSSPESAESESCASRAHARDASKVLGSSTGACSSSLKVTFPSVHSPAAAFRQHGNETQPADVAAGPSSGGIRGQTTDEDNARKEFPTPIDAVAVSYAESAGQSEIDWAAVAKLAAAKTNLVNESVDESFLEEAEHTSPTHPGHSISNITPKNAQSQDRFSLAGGDVPQSPLVPTSPADHSNPVCDDNGSTSSSSSDGNPNPWLIDAVTGALGPRGIGADLESLSERSHRSSRSQKSPGQTSPTKSVRSENSQTGVKQSSAVDISAASVASSRASHHSRRSQQSSVSAKSITSDLLRLEAQLKAMESRDGGSPVKMTQSFGSDACSQSNPVTPSPPKSTRYIGRRTRISVEAPPGRLGVILANRSDGKGTVVSALRTSSPLVGRLSPGDRLEAIDGEDVSEMKVSDVTAIMAKKADREKTLTVVTPGKIRLGGSSQLSPKPGDSKKKSSVTFSQ